MAVLWRYAGHTHRAGLDFGPTIQGLQKGTVNMVMWGMGYQDNVYFFCRLLVFHEKSSKLPCERIRNERMRNKLFLSR